MDKKTDQKTESKTDAISKRNERGQFQPGTAAGPGRGHTSDRDQLEAIEDLIDLVSEAARQGILQSKHVGDRLRAAKLALAVTQLKKPDDSGPVMEPFVADLMFWLTDMAQRYFQKTGTSITPMEMVDLLPDICRGCERVGPTDDWFEEVSDDNDDD